MHNYLRLLELLWENEQYELRDLATELSVGERQVKRYLETLERFFNLDYRFDGKPFIF